MNKRLAIQLERERAKEPRRFDFSRVNMRPSVGDNLSKTRELHKVMEAMWLDTLAGCKP